MTWNQGFALRCCRRKREGGRKIEGPKEGKREGGREIKQVQQYNMIIIDSGEQGSGSSLYCSLLLYIFCNTLKN